MIKIWSRSEHFDFRPLFTVASNLVEAGGRASVVKSKKWAKSFEFYANTHDLKSEASKFEEFSHR